MDKKHISERLVNELEANASTDQDAVSRRALLSGAGALGAVLAGLPAYGADNGAHRHADHAPKYPDALTAANDCTSTGHRCIAHCLVSFQEGDTTLADCARTVNDMISLCDAFALQVASNSPYIAALSDICRQACSDCEKECRKHESSHAECKECADACAGLVAAIDAM